MYYTITCEIPEISKPGYCKEYSTTHYEVEGDYTFQLVHDDYWKICMAMSLLKIKGSKVVLSRHGFQGYNGPISEQIIK